MKRSKKVRVHICTVFCCLFCVGWASAEPIHKKVLNYTQHDKKFIHFGFCLGLNAMDFEVTPSLKHYPTDSLQPGVAKLSPGFHIQAVSAMRLSDNLELRFLPGVAFGARLLSFFKHDRPHDDNHSLESSYIELPLLLKYKSDRVNNYRAYLVGGLNPRFDLAKTYYEDKEIYMDLKLNDLCYEFGGGFDFYFPFFKMSLEIRGSWGLFNILNIAKTPHPEFQNAVDKLRSSSYMFSIYIE